MAVASSAGAAIPGLAKSPATAGGAAQARDDCTDATRHTAFTAAGFLVIGLIASRLLGGTSKGPRPGAAESNGEPAREYAAERDGGRALQGQPITDGTR